MKKLLFILSLTILTACGGSDSVDEPLIVNPIDEISGEYILDRFVANSNTQSMCPSYLSISEELYRLELNYKDLVVQYQLTATLQILKPMKISILREMKLENLQMTML